MSNRTKSGICILIWGFTMWYLETAFFGFNMMPGSIAELVADGIVSSAQLLGIYLIFTKKQSV